MSEILIVDGLEKTFPDSRPRYILKKASILSDERFGFQVVVNSRAELEQYVLKTESDIGSCIRLREVGYVPCRRAGYDKDTDDDYVIFKKHADTYYPDVLYPSDGRFVSNGNSWKTFFVTVEGALPAGRHRIKFVLFNETLGVEEGCAETELFVLNAVLPAFDIYYTTWFHYDCLADAYRMRVFSERFIAVMNNFFADAVKHGMNTIYTPLFTPPLDTKIGSYRKTVQLVDVYKENKKYRFSFDRLLRFMQNAERVGFRYFEMSHLATQWGAEFTPKIVAEVGGKKKRIFGWDKESLSEEYTAFLRQFLPQLAVFLDKNGYAGRCFFHISDEPNVSHADRYGKLSALVHELLKDYPVMDALSDFEFYARKFVDIPVVATECAQSFADKNVDTWVYYCCTQAFNGLSNRFFNMPLQRTRILGAQLYLNNAKGFLHWGYNFYYSALSVRKLNPFYETDADENLPGGDCFIVYPGEKGEPFSSLRNEAFYDGLQDYRALKLLEELENREFVCRFLAEEGMRGYFEYPQSAEWHRAFREKLNAMIAERIGT